MSALLGLLLTSFQAQDIPGLQVREPRPPAATHLSYEATCGSMRLRIENYGHVRPSGRTPRVVLNGRRVVGEMAIALERDLAVPGALYHFATRCPQSGNELQFELTIGKKMAGVIEYQAGRATFRNGRLVFHEPLIPAAEADFWFS